MFKTFAAALLFGLTACAVPPAPSAAAPVVAIADAQVAAMPAPQAPFDDTPITAVETVGAARGE